MRLLGLDFETTGLDPEEDLVIEVGAVVWDTDLGQPLLIDNFFVNHGIEIGEEITKLNGVHQNFIDEFGLDSREALIRIQKLESKCDAIVAHNGTNFDKLFYKYWYNTVFEEDLNIQREILWIDSREDIEYPEGTYASKLIYLAAEHGFLNPFAHRACFDVLTMMAILSKYPIEDIIYSAKQPMVLVQSMTEYHERDLAKKARFYWDADRKMWLRLMKEHRIAKSNFPFKTRIVNQ
jgi:DNA polymerase III subunit epsilon